MTTDTIEDILNSANDAIQSESYELAKSLYQQVLNIDPSNWEALIYYSLSSNMNIPYSQCDNAISSVTKVLVNIPVNIKANENVPEVISFYCSDFCTLVSKFALHIYKLNTAEFDRIKLDRTYYSRLSPIAFLNNYLYPTTLKLSDMLFKFGDLIELNFAEQIDMKPVTNVWNTGNILLDICVHNAGFFKKMEYKSKISNYKKKIKQYK